MESLTKFISSVQLSLKEYEKLKLESKKIPVEFGGGFEIVDGMGYVIKTSPIKIKIDLKQLKLQICEQNGINPKATVIEFY